MSKNIFIACDISSQKEVINLLEKIHHNISGIKIGLQYITQRSPEDIRELSKFKKPIFYDGKFFDIKNNLISSIKALDSLNVSYATVHLLNGEETLNAIVEQTKDIKFVGVSVLTSFSNSDLESLGFVNDVNKQVERLVKIAAKVNLHGVVCSPLEVKMVKKIAPKLACFTPGIRLESSDDDQKRTMSPKEAINQGSDYLILGRPLTSGNPKENIKKIVESLK